MADACGDDIALTPVDDQFHLIWCKIANSLKTSCQSKDQLLGNAETIQVRTSPKMEANPTNQDLARLSITLLNQAGETCLEAAVI